MSTLNICIVGLKCYDQILQAPVPRYLGGIETQLAILARGLAADGSRVSIITFDHGYADGEMIDGVTVLKSYRPEAGIRGLRSFHPRMTAVWAAMRRADADVYLQMGAGAETGVVALGCKMMTPRRSFVFCLASNANFGAHLHAGVFGWEGRLYQFGLRAADLVVSQTADQRSGLLRATGVESQVIPMAVAPPEERVSEHPSARRRVLWIGRITADKRLEWLLEAAAKCPEIAFDVVGTPNSASPYATRLIESAAQLPNVAVHGRVSNAELAALYRITRLLCCTSRLEGFPTSFLEAWSQGIPVVTTFDPDATVERHALGAVVTDVGDLVSHLREFMRDSARYSIASDAAREFYTANHTVAAISRRFREQLAQLSHARCPMVAAPSLS